MDDIRELSSADFPLLLTQMTDPPVRLRIRGALPLPEFAYLAVVGSRECSQYARACCERLIGGLSGYPVAIVSGLALGIDSIAHDAALAAGLPTVAIPGSGLSWNVLYPKTHHGLAKRILAAGGALISEFDDDFEAAPWSFPKRNRIMAGISKASLIVEAREKSGTLITARLAMEYNRDVCVVPGSILSDHAAGSNRFLRDGAIPVTSAGDILDVLGIARTEAPAAHLLSADEALVMEHVKEPVPRDELIRALGMSASEANRIIATLEIKGVIVERLGVVRRT